MKFHALLSLLILKENDGFLVRHSASQVQAERYATPEASTVGAETANTGISKNKAKLLELLGKKEYTDPVLVDPTTKESLKLSVPGVLIGGERGTNRGYELVSINNENVYGGTSKTYFDLLEQDEKDSATDDEEDADMSNLQSATNFAGSIVRNMVPMIPPQIRSPLARAGLPLGEEYVPMRDLFTSPSVSFAYERGWRQGFAAAGFPGPDKEAKMASDYFADAISKCDGTESSVLVDMSCATGLFTRRFTSSGKYGRVLGCDYSPSMLQEARRRINLEGLSDKKTRLDLIRLDVGKIPMRDNSVDALNAGAAMHCWPDLPAAVAEIHRVLKPGGRYFATTFLSSYFGVLRAADGSSMDVSSQAFQYFESLDQLRDLLVEEGGFDPEKVSVELIEPAAIVIRCEK